MRQPGLRRRGGVLRICMGLFLVASLVMIGLLGAAYLHFSNGQNSDFLRQRVLGAVSEIFGPQAIVSLERAGLNFEGAEPLFSISNLDIDDPATGLSIKLGQLDLGMTTVSLLKLSPDPTDLAISSIHIQLPADDKGRDTVAITQAALAGIADLARMATRVPNLVKVNIEALSLSRADATGGPLSFGHVMTLSARREDQQIRLDVTRRQRAGGAPVSARAIGLTLSAQQSEPAGQGFTMRSEPGALGALVDLLGFPLAVIDPGVRLEAELDAGVSASGQRGLVKAEFRLGGGQLDFSPYGIPAFVLNEVLVGLSGEAGSSLFALPRVRLRSQETVIDASGSLDIDGAFKTLRLSALNPVIESLLEGQAPLAFEAMSLEARVSRDLSAAIIDRFVVTDQGGELIASARFGKADGGSIETQVSAQQLDIRKALRLWPVFTAPEVRNWVIERTAAGTLASLALKSSLAGEALRNAWSKKPIPDDSVQAQFRLENVEISPVPQAPAVRRAQIAGAATGRSAVLTLEQGEMAALAEKPVSLAGATFAVADAFLDPPVLEMKLPVIGPLEGVIAVLSSPGLRNAVSIPAEVAKGSGTVDGQIIASLRLAHEASASDLKVEARADLKNVSVNAIAPGENLESGQFRLQVATGAVTLRGEGRLNGTPAQIEFRAVGQQTPVATIKAVFDEAQRQRRGFERRAALSGPVGVTVKLEFERNASPGVSVALDLTQAKVEGLFPGQIKRAGQPGKASFDYLARPDRIILDNFSLEIGTVAAQGRIEFGKDSQLIKADLANLRLSPGDIVRASFERLRTGMRVSLRGNSFDVRPFLRGLQAGRIDDSKGVDADIDIQTTVLVGFSGELISAADVALQLRNGRASRVQVKGRFGGNPLSVDTLDGQPRDELLMRVSSGDGGALLRFLDFYTKAYGGRLSADIRVTKESQSGLVQMREFAIRGEPLLARYTGEVSAARSPSQTIARTGNRESVSFTKMRAEFDRRPGRIELNEAVMWGDQVGGTLEGVLDYGADRVDLKGALVPAYALNNLFAQVPILGPIFGGSQYEGLFALPFVIQGKASAPLLRTNALSVIAPGFLRKLFEIQREGSPTR
ncbi:Domain of unknown function DUF3971 [Rhabdaerophilaceae bacterium]